MSDPIEQSPEPINHAKLGHKKEKWECVSQILNHYKDPGSDGYRTYKLIFDATCVDDVVDALKSLERSMNANAESNTDLARKVFWLNIVLAVISLVGVIYTICSFYKP